MKGKEESLKLNDYNNNIKLIEFFNWKLKVFGLK